MLPLKLLTSSTIVEVVVAIIVVDVVAVVRVLVVAHTTLAGVVRPRVVVILVLGRSITLVPLETATCQDAGHRAG